MPTDQLDHLRRLFGYDAWANREALASIRASGGPSRALGLLAHIIAAERLWLERLRAEPQSMAVWPALTIADCERHLADLGRFRTEYLASLTLDGLARLVSYTSTKGERWSNTIEDVLTHVVIHSAYHRGQIAAEVRASAHTPAYTDFIHAARQGLLEPSVLSSTALDISGDEADCRGRGPDASRGEH